jgi:hypothetical protein
MDSLYKNLIENGWKMHEIDEMDIFDFIRLMNKKKSTETGVADKKDKSAFNFLP